MTINIGDRVLTKNNRFWSNKIGTVRSTVEYEFHTIYMVLLDESGLSMGFKENELQVI